MPPSRIVILAALIAMACAKSAPTETVVDPRPGFDRQEKVWVDAGVTNYTMEQEVRRFAGAGATARLTVRNGVITDAVYVATGDLVPVGARSLYYTVPHMFTLMRSVYAAAPSKFDVLYDATLGYPVRIIVDPTSAISDDDYVIITGKVVKLTATR